MIAAAVTALALLAALCWALRARLISADLRRISAELDAANLAGAALAAEDHVAWHRRARAALQMFDASAGNARQLEAQLTATDEGNAAWASAIDEMYAEIEAELAESDRLLLAQAERHAAALARRDVQAEQLGDRVAGLEAAIAQVVGDRDAHAGRAQELARRVSELEQDTAVLDDVARSAAADVAAYASPRGTMTTWDEHRVGRMLRRDAVLAELVRRRDAASQGSAT